MISRNHSGSRCVARALLALALLALPTRAQDSPLALMIGTWDVRVEIRRPEPAVVTYRERYAWALGGKYVLGRTEGRSDGEEDLILGTFDPDADGYPFWFFSSTGSYIYLPPGRWDARRRALVFENPANWELEYRTVATYPDDRTREWSVLVKDWKGTVLSEQYGRATRVRE